MSHALRRHEAARHQARRLSEDRNQHFADLACACWTDPRAIARFREQPAQCSCWACGNPRRYAKGGERLTRQERRDGLPPPSERHWRSYGTEPLPRRRQQPGGAQGRRAPRGLIVRSSSTAAKI
jgi:hypothetical protein